MSIFCGKRIFSILIFPALRAGKIIISLKNFGAQCPLVSLFGPWNADLDKFFFGLLRSPQKHEFKKKLFFFIFFFENFQKKMSIFCGKRIFSILIFPALRAGKIIISLKNFGAQCPLVSLFGPWNADLVWNHPERFWAQIWV